MFELVEEMFKATKPGLSSFANDPQKVLLKHIYLCIVIFATLCYAGTANAVMRCLSVCLSRSRIVKMNKRIFELFHCWVAKPFQFFHT